MLDLTDRPTLDPYVLTRELPPAAAFWTSPARGSGSDADTPALPPPSRFLALHMGDQTSHVAYRFPEIPEPSAREAFRHAVDLAAAPRHAHLLRIERCLFKDASPWLITPFAGDVDGVRPLSRLLKEKNGQMPAMEVERAVVQLFEALSAAHASPAFPRHGLVSIDHVLVNRHGSLSIELYALANLLQGVYPMLAAPPLSADAALIEVQSIVEIGYQLLTGLRAECPLIPASRVVKGLDPNWDAWFARGLGDIHSGSAFKSAQEAIDNLPGNLPPPPPSKAAVRVRTVLSWIKPAAQSVG